MEPEEAYHYSVQDDEADLRHQQMVNEWQEYEHFKQQEQPEKQVEGEDEKNNSR